MYNKKRYSNDEIIINFGDLLFYLLKHWKCVLVVAVLGCFLGTYIGYVKGNVAYEPTQEDIAKMNKAYSYKLLYEEQTAYNTEARLENIAEKQYARGELKYYIKSKSDMLALAEKLNITGDSEFIEKLREITGYEGAEQFLTKIVEFIFDPNENDLIYFNNVNESQTTTTIDNEHGIITYSVKYIEKNECEEVFEYIEQKVAELKKEFDDVYDDCQIELTNRSIVDVGNTDIYGLQKSLADQAVENMHLMKECVEEFSSEQLAYYNTVYLGNEAEETGIKWIWSAIGFVFAAACVGFIYIVRYFFNGRFKVVSELDKYNLPLLGNIVEHDKRTGLDKLISKWQARTRTSSCSIKYLIEAMKLSGDKDLLLVLSSENEVLSKVSSNFIKESDGVQELQIVSGLDADTVGLMKAKKASGIIFMILLGTTKKKQFERQLEICDIYNIPVKGVVAVERY